MKKCNKCKRLMSTSDNICYRCVNITTTGDASTNNIKEDEDDANPVGVIRKRNTDADELIDSSEEEDNGRYKRKMEQQPKVIVETCNEESDEDDDDVESTKASDSPAKRTRYQINIANVNDIRKIEQQSKVIFETCNEESGIDAGDEYSANNTQDFDCPAKRTRYQLNIATLNDSDSDSTANNSHILSDTNTTSDCFEYDTDDTSNYESDDNELYIINNLFDLDICCNCGRYKPSDTEMETDPYKLVLQHIDLRSWREQRRFNRKFCHINFDSYIVSKQNNYRGQNVLICDECNRYLLRDKNKDFPEEVWPAFVWSVLKEPTLCVDAWKMVPECWRHWWKKTIQQRYGEDEYIMLIAGSAQIKDVSKEMECDLAALNKLRWAKDLMPRELSLTLPTIKCPAGCSEWKHKANNIPFDIIWEIFLGKELLLFSNRKFLECAGIIRKDYFIPNQLARNPNPDWTVQASIARNGNNGVPMILSCRHHNHKSKGMMLHPCRSPTGTTFHPHANQFCPAIATPRTIRKAKVHAYSASFQMASLQGSYDGLDTMYLTSDGGYYYHQSLLAWKREVLAVKGRKDIKAYVSKLIHDKQIGNNFYTRFEADGKILYPNWNDLKDEYQLGSTYMSVRDSLKLYNSIRYEGIEEVQLEPNANGHRKTISFSGAWPQYLAWIHPTNDKHGREMLPMIPFNMQDHDTRAIWITSSMVSYIPELWNCITKVPKMVESWEGWILTLVANQCFPHSGFNTRLANPFARKKNFTTLFLEHFEVNTAVPISMDINTLKSKFQPTILQPTKFSNIEVQTNKLDTSNINGKDIIIVLHDINADNSTDWIPSNDTYKDLELRYVCFTTEGEKNLNHWKGTIYCRYGGTEHPNWWCINRKNHKAIRKGNNWDLNQIPQDSMLNWTVCVYVKSQPIIHPELKHAILTACGGQTKVYCKNHNYPLICIPHNNDNKQQCTCGNKKLPDCLPQQYTPIVRGSANCSTKVSFICPYEGCKVGICKIHHSQVIEGDQLFYVGNAPNDCHYGVHPLNDEQHETNNSVNSVNNLIDSTPTDSNTNTIADSDTTTISDNNSIPQPIPFFDCDNEKEDPIHGLSINFPNMQTNDDPIESSFCLQENDLQEYFITTPPNIIDQVEDTDVELRFPNYEKDIVPTTNAGLRPIYSVVQNEPYASNRISNHVILNHYGSCLIRRNKPISGTLKQRNFLQGITAKMPGHSIPLLYPEAMLFTDQFFLDNNDGSIIGALPAAALHNEKVLQQHGICSLHDHYRTRMANVGILASTNPTYHFWAFDSLVNLGMRGCDARVILRRGFTGSETGNGIKMRGEEDPIFDTEQVDCRPIVNQLAAAIGEKQPTYFYTHTCGMKTHFGIKLLWEWLMSDDLLQQLCEEDDSFTKKEQLRQNMIDSCGVLLLRAWMEISHIWIRYITKSPEEPIGKILQSFFRFELQDADALANLPHIHSILWTADDLNDPKGLETALDRIRGFLEDILRRDEKDRFIDEKIFANEEAIVCFIEMMGNILPHKHLRRCFAVVKNKITEEEEIELKCKVTDNYKANPCPGIHSIIDIPVQHTQNAIKVMQTIDVCKSQHPDNDGTLFFDPLVPCLKAQKHIPPARSNDGIISPVPGVLVARNPSSSNIQFTTGYLLSRYLAKYVASIDAYNVINIQPPDPRNNQDTFDVTGSMQLNTKITGNKIQIDKINKNINSKNPKQRQARAVNITETYMLMYNYPSVIKDIPFINIPTQPYEERSAKKRRIPLEIIFAQNKNLWNRYLQRHALTAIDTNACHHVRKTSSTFPPWRQFTTAQIMKFNDDIQSPLSTDKVTIFGFRPPELHFVMQQEKYARWFIRIKPSNTDNLNDQIKYCKQHLDGSNLNNSSWIDAGTYLIKLRQLAIDEILDYIMKGPDYFFVNHQVKNLILNLLKKIKAAIVYKTTGQLGTIRYSQIGMINNLYQTFVCETDMHKYTMLPVIWYKSVRPTQPLRFLIHLLLSFGEFIEEYSLFNQPSLRDSFIYAHLLNDTQPLESAKKLMKKYLLQQLITLPAGTLTFDRYCVAGSRRLPDKSASVTWMSGSCCETSYWRASRRRTSR